MTNGRMSTARARTSNRATTAAVALVFIVIGHVRNWPIVRGGSRELSNALVSVLHSLGGEVRLDTRIRSLDDLPPSRVVLFDFFHQVRKAGVPASVKEFLTLLEALDRCSASFAEGTFRFEPTDEDLHGAIERWLLEELGDLGLQRGLQDLPGADPVVLITDGLWRTMFGEIPASWGVA